MKTYMIRINTIDNLYADYIVQGRNLFEAKHNAKKAFFRDYPSADKHLIRVSLGEVDKEVINEVMNIIKEVNKEDE